MLIPIFGGFGSAKNIAAHFDGTNDWLDRGAELTGLSDGKEFTLSLWVNFTGKNAGDHTIIRNNTGFFLLEKRTDNFFDLFMYNSAGGAVWLWSGSTAYTTSSGYLHFLASGNMATTTGHVYINDSVASGSGTPANDTINLAAGDWTVGGRSAASGFEMDGDLFDVWFDDSFLDISSASNRRKFIDASGGPVGLGSDGSTPTGAAPLLFLGDADVDSWHTNKGTGGGLTENGALTEATAPV